MRQRSVELGAPAAPVSVSKPSAKKLKAKAGKAAAGGGGGGSAGGSGAAAGARKAVAEGKAAAGGASPKKKKKVQAAAAEDSSDGGGGARRAAKAVKSTLSDGSLDEEFGALEYPVTLTRIIETPASVVAARSGAAATGSKAGGTGAGSSKGGGGGGLQLTKLVDLKGATGNTKRPAAPPAGGSGIGGGSDGGGGGMPSRIVRPPGAVAQITRPRPTGPRNCLHIWFQGKVRPSLETWASCP